MNTLSAPKSAKDSALHRRSIRKYEEQDIPKEQIDELLTLAGRAPSAWNIQPWHVYAIRSQDVKDKIQAAAPYNRHIQSAPIVLVITSDMALALTRLHDALRHFSDEQRATTIATIHGVFDAMPVAARESWGRNQSYIFLGYLLLIAETMGLGTSPMLGFDPAGVRNALSLEAHVEVVALVAVGYAAEEGLASSRLPIETISTIIE